METYTQYLYEYEKGKRIRSLGFAKVEKQMDRCVIQIYVKDMDELKGFLFQKMDGTRYTGTWEEEVEKEVEKEATLQAEEYIIPKDVRYEKIQRQDLSRLPRKEWRLANNSFLLHGFYNYHHLLYIEEQGQIWIGVPGIYHEKEKMAANAFGFTQFKHLVEVPIELEQEEKNTYEDFGYWCRQVAVS